MDPTPEEDLVEVLKCWGEAEAELFRSMLRSFGIDSILSGESTRLTHPVTVSKLAQVRVLVRHEDAQRARELIDHPPSDSGAVAPDDGDS